MNTNQEREPRDAAALLLEIRHLWLKHDRGPALRGSDLVRAWAEVGRALGVVDESDAQSGEKAPIVTGWFADVDTEQSAYRWQPCLNLDAGHIPCFQVWFATKEECVDYIIKEILPHAGKMNDR